MENLTFTDGLLGGQPWLDEPENGPTFFPNPPLASDEPAVIKNFDPERQPKLDFVLPAISQTDANANPTPPPEAPRSRFHDPEALDARWDATDDGFDYTPEMKAEVYNRIGIAREYGDSVDDIVDIYPVLRGQYGHEVLGNYDITEVELDRHFRDEAKFKKDLEIAVADMPGRIVADILGDLVREQSTPVEEGYRRWKADHPEYGTSVSDSDVLEAAQLYHTEIRSKLLPYARQLRDLNDLLAWRTGQTAQSSASTAPDAPAVRERLLDTLAGLPSDLRKLIYIGVADGANRLGYLDDKEVGTQFYELLGRNINILTDAALNTQEIDADARLKLLQSDVPLYRSGNGEIFRKYFPDSWADESSTQLEADERKRIIEETQHKLTRLGVERDLRNLADTGYDAIRNKHEGVAGFLETALYGTASSAGYTGLAMLPGGAYLAIAAAGSNSYKTLRIDHPEISIADARNIAAFSGVIQGSIERVQARVLLGKFPALERMMNKWANPILVGRIPRTAARAVAMTAGENLVEGAQDLTTPFIQDMAHALQKDIPDVNWFETLSHWAGERADVAAGLSLMLVTSLFGIHSRERRMLNSPEQRRQLLELTGFSPEQISRIEQSGTVEEKLAKAREELANRNQADISRGAKLYQAELDAANAKHFDPEQAKMLSPVLMMSKQSEVKPADIGRYWLKIAEDPKTATYTGIPKATKLGAVMEELTGDARQLVDIESIPTKDPNLPDIVKFTEKNNGGYILLKPVSAKEFYIFSAQAGNLGTPIYQTAFSWAHNNGYRIVGDPHGFLDLGATRQTTHMFNSALRFRTTRHMQPHPEQEIEGWRDDDTAEAVEHNIGLLAMRESELVRKNLNWLDDLAYREGSFYHGNIPISAENRDSYIGARIAELDSNFTQGAGPRTVARALVTAAAQRSGDRLGGVLGTVPNSAALEGVLYSQAERTAPLSESTRAQVEDWIDSATKNWRKDISVKIHDSADLIPDEKLRQTVLNEVGTVEGFYNPADRSIHILADRMHSEADVHRVLRHEGMHWAFANALQKEYRELLAGARAKIPKERIDELLTKYPKASDATIVEEYLAYEGQNNPKSTVWVTFAYEAKRLLRKVFGDRVEFTDKDILAFLSKANRKLTDQKAGDRVSTSGGTADQSDGLVSFAKAQPGMKLSQVGNDFVVDDTPPEKILSTGSVAEKVAAAAAVFQKWDDSVSAADGSIVTLKAPEAGSIAARVRHLIFDHKAERISDEKLKWLPNVPSTLAHAAVRLVDSVSGNLVYVRAYRGGTKHMVVVRPDGKVESQKPFTGRLITQFPDGSGSQQSMKIDWIRPSERN